MESHLERSITDAAELLPKLRELGDPLATIGRAMMSCWDKGGKILMAGNGGSMADAMHFAEELSVRFEKNRRALPAVALSDPAAITCSGNDFGFDTIFSRQVDALGRPGDVLVVFSTSGNSENILRAVDRARQGGLTCVGFTGRDGGKLAARCDLCLIVPSDSTARIQEAHKLLLHTLCAWVDAQVGE